MMDGGKQGGSVICHYRQLCRTESLAIARDNTAASALATPLADPSPSGCHDFETQFSHQLINNSSAAPLSFSPARQRGVRVIISLCLRGIQ